MGPDPFGEGPDELGGQLGAQTRNLPAERSGRNLIEQGQRNGDGDTVMAGSRFEDVTHRKIEIANLPMVGEGVGVDRVGVDEVIKGQVELVTILDSSPPGVEMGSRDDTFRNTTVVEGEDDVVVGDQSALTATFLEVDCLVPNPVIVFEETVIGSPVPLHQGGTDEDLSGDDRVYAPVVDAMICPQRYPEEDRPLGGDHGGRRGCPVRSGPGTLDERSGDLLHPLRLDGPTAGRSPPVRRRQRVPGTCAPAGIRD